MNNKEIIKETIKLTCPVCDKEYEMELSNEHNGTIYSKEAYRSYKNSIIQLGRKCFKCQRK